MIKATPTPAMAKGLRATALFLLVCVAVGAYLVASNQIGAREYWLYLTQDRPTMNFRFTEMSEDWSESDLKAHFKGTHFECYALQPPQRESAGQRNCYTDISVHNGLQTMLAQFFFTDGKLDKITLMIPWWRHSAMLSMLTNTYGPPIAAHRNPVQGVRLYGWSLSNNSAIFCNRDHPFNPLDSHSVLWLSARACKTQGCFLPETGA